MIATTNNKKISKIKIASNLLITKVFVGAQKVFSMGAQVTYKIDNGNEITTQDLSVELLQGQKIIVKAISDNDEYSDSDYSEEKIYAVEPDIDDDPTVDPPENNDDTPVETPDVDNDPPIETPDNNNTPIIIVFVLIGVVVLGVSIFIVKKIFY